MTPEERAKGLVEANVFLVTNTPYIHVCGWCFELANATEMRSAATAIRIGLAKVIRDAINEALLEQSRLAFRAGLPLSEEEEQQLFHELVRVISFHGRSEARGTVARVLSELAKQLAAYRQLIASMARDNGYQDGFEAGKTFSERK